MSVAVVIVVAALAVAAMVVVLNGIAYFPLWRSGWRPRRIPPTDVRLAFADPHVKVPAKLIIGWPGQQTPVGVVLIDRKGARLLGGGPPIRIERARVSAVRRVRWGFGTWLLFEATDREYSGFLIKPDDMGAALQSFRRLEWPVP